MNESNETNKKQKNSNKKKIEETPLKTDADTKETSLNTFKNGKTEDLMRETEKKDFEEENTTGEQPNLSNLFNDFAGEETLHIPGYDSDEGSKQNTFSDTIWNTYEGTEKTIEFFTSVQEYNEPKEAHRKRKYRRRSLFSKLSAVLSLLILTFLIIFLIWSYKPDNEKLTMTKPNTQRRNTTSFDLEPNDLSPNYSTENEKTTHDDFSEINNAIGDKNHSDSVAALPDQRRDSSSSLFNFDRVEMKAKIKAEILLEEPDVIAVFYPKDFNEEQLKQRMKKTENNFLKKDEYLSSWDQEEMVFKEVIQPVKVNNFENLQNDANDFRISIGKGRLNENELKASITKKMIDTSILQHKALELYASVDFEKEVNKEVKQISQRVNNKTEFDKWVVARYGSEKTFKNLLRNNIIEEKYLNDRNLDRDKTIQELKSNLKILLKENR